jgi:hypothetical protein
MSAHKKLGSTSANWRKKHPLSRMPQLGKGNWLGQGHEKDRPQLDSMDSSQPRYEVQASPFEAIDLAP